MEKPLGQINEKTVMFSRKLLDPGSERYEKYYEEFPGHKEPDLHFRSKPGLLNEHAAFYDPFAFNTASAILKSVKAFHPIVDGEPAQRTSDIEAEKIASSIRKWILREGAVSVGFTKTHDYHWNSVIGRGDDFGKRAQLPHSHAIAFTVEMDKKFMDTAPHAPTVMESANQYMRAAVIATEVAMIIRKLGYHARAHIDGNYRVVCPLVARDAGLGEIGRMGILMTPEIGPRVRIAVVTTDLPLPLSAKADHSHMIKFCRICKKCAHVCPSQAISVDDRKDIHGVKRWQINQESCYTYWCIAGTDCGKCMSDCPYSHPNNLFHNMIRALIKNSFIFRHFAVKMDDFFYGRKPKPKPIPKWFQGT
ncbi:MAG: 4Fe-4S dicluster domain-containing protein [Bacteroidetes bacterium]|nr:4Fe-4S dicluster domain-containing protein [Bacteroidota bacterium]